MRDKSLAARSPISTSVPDTSGSKNQGLPNACRLTTALDDESDFRRFARIVTLRIAVENTLQMPLGGGPIGGLQSSFELVSL